MAPRASSECFAHPGSQIVVNENVAPILGSVLSLFGTLTFAQRISPQAPVPDRRVVIAATVLLNGKDRVLRNTRIAVEGSMIVAIDPNAEP